MTDSLPPMARPRVAAGVLIYDEAGRVLLVKPSYKDGWDLPGGYVEPDESPAAACARELAEELGIQRTIGRLAVIDWAPHPAEGDKLLFVFDGGRIDPTTISGLTLQQSEIVEVRLWPADEIAAVTPERLTRRILLAMRAVREHHYATYSEHGHPSPERQPQ